MRISVNFIKQFYHLFTIMIITLRLSIISIAHFIVPFMSFLFCFFPETALTNFRHEPVKLRQFSETNMSIIVFYTWLGVVSFMIIIAFVIAKHRQKVRHHFRPINSLFV